MAHEVYSRGHLQSASHGYWQLHQQPSREDELCLPQVIDTTRITPRMAQPFMEPRPHN
jgi:hypothetical protein